MTAVVRRGSAPIRCIVPVEIDFNHSKTAPRIFTTTNQPNRGGNTK